MADQPGATAIPAGGHLAPWQFYPLALANFACQLVFSRLWLAHHEQGPMERRWRLGTYGWRLTHGQPIAATAD